VKKHEDFPYYNFILYVISMQIRKLENKIKMQGKQWPGERIDVYNLNGRIIDYPEKENARWQLTR
jgi:hypothetical protein